MTTRISNDPQVDAESETAYETVRSAFAGDDAPMEDGQKVATAALAGATYPVILGALIILGLVVAYFTVSRTSDVWEISTKASAPEAFR